MKSQTLSLIIALGVTVSPMIMATPPWAASVNPNEMSETARAHWDSAIQQWDVINFDAALDHLQRAAQIEGDSPELWVATADAATEVADRHSRRDALDHLELADLALSRLHEIPEVPESIEIRAQSLETAVAENTHSVTQRLLRDANDPIDLGGLRPGLIPQRDHWRRRNATIGTGGDFYSSNPDWRNGNYNVLARRRAESAPPRSELGPINVSIRASQNNRPGPRSLQPTPIGFGVNHPAVRGIPRWNQGWGVRRPASLGSGE